MNRKPLTKSDFDQAALKVGCEAAVLMAIAEVETGWKPGKSGFITVPESKYEKAHVAPIILYERHVFSRLTKGKFDKSHPHLSNPKWMPGTYGPSATQHHKLQEASLLDRDAAMQSCSWGVFQLMGFNWKLMGYTNLQDFITEMYWSDKAQLDGLLRFLTGSNLKGALVLKDWRLIAKIYNGDGYERNAYHTKLAASYKKFSTQ